MGTKTITITNEAYNFLKSLKGDKSFSETIISLKRKDRDLSRFVGCMKGVDFSSVERMRDELNKEFKEREKELWKQ